MELVPSLSSDLPQPVGVAGPDFYDGWARHYGGSLNLLGHTEQGLGWGPGVPTAKKLFQKCLELQDSSGFTVRRPIFEIVSNALQAPQLTWLHKSPDALEVAGLGGGGMLHWSELEFRKDGSIAATAKRSPSPGPYLATGLVATVTPTAVHWLRPYPSGLTIKAAAEVSLPAALACFPRHGALGADDDQFVGRVARLSLRD